MINYLFLGDTHADLDFVVRACEMAADYKAEIIQVGDFGFVWPAPKRGYATPDLSELSAVLNKHGIVMRFICGNHDWHEKIWEMAPTRFPTEIAPNVIYQPRGSTYADPDGTKFLFMGGAPSIDKAHRTVGRSWWPTEEITDEDMAVALQHEYCDVLVTHDAPDYPAGFLPKGDSEFRIKSKRSMNNVKKLLTCLGPKLHIHGHWHHAHVDGVTRGLDCNYGKFNSSVYLWSNK